MSLYLFVSNPKEYIDFLKNVFFADELDRTIHPEHNDIVNCILKIGNSCFMISQAREPFLNMKTSMYLFVDDVDELHRNAIENGATLVFEAQDMSYGDRQSGVLDPSGNYWWISKRLVKVNYEDV